MDVIKITSYLVLYIFLVLAVIQDMISMRVGNRLILVGLSSSFLFRLVGAGFEGILGFLVNITIPVIILYLFYLLRILGAGDIKLFSLVGSYLNLKELIYCIIVSLIIGAILSVIKMMYEGNFKERIQCGIMYICELSRGDFKAYSTRDVSNLIPFSIAILGGTMTVMLQNIL